MGNVQNILESINESRSNKLAEYKSKEEEMESRHQKQKEALENTLEEIQGKKMKELLVHQYRELINDVKKSIKNLNAELGNRIEAEEFGKDNTLILNSINELNQEVSKYIENLNILKDPTLTTTDIRKINEELKSTSMDTRLATAKIRNEKKPNIISKFINWIKEVIERRRLNREKQVIKDSIAKNNKFIDTILNQFEKIDEVKNNGSDLPVELTKIIIKQDGKEVRVDDKTYNLCNEGRELNKSYEEELKQIKERLSNLEHDSDEKPHGKDIKKENTEIKTENNEKNERDSSKMPEQPENTQEQKTDKVKENVEKNNRQPKTWQEREEVYKAGIDIENRIMAQKRAIETIGYMQKEAAQSRLNESSYIYNDKDKNKTEISVTASLTDSGNKVIFSYTMDGKAVSEQDLNHWVIGKAMENLENIRVSQMNKALHSAADRAEGEGKIMIESLKREEKRIAKAEPELER